jgi:hypothetical protein
MDGSADAVSGDFAENQNELRLGNQRGLERPSEKRRGTNEMICGFEIVEATQPHFSGVGSTSGHLLLLV